MSKAVTNSVVMKEYETIYPDDMVYLTHNRLLSHNADISWSQSIRNLGKSYDAMKLMMNTLDIGRNVAWLRWDRKECKIAEHELERFLESHGAERYNRRILSNSNVSYIEDTVTNAYVYIMPVKDASGVKGMDIPNIKWIIYDECIPEFYDIRTRRIEEFDKFMSLYVSLKRDSEDTRVLLMSNRIDWFTGYTQSWGIMPFRAGVTRVFRHTTVMDSADGRPFEVTHTIAFENVMPSRAMIERNMRDYAIRGERFDLEGYFGGSADTTYSLIDKCPDLSEPLADVQFMWDGEYFSYRNHEGNIYFTQVRKRKGIDTYVFRVQDLSQHYEDRTIRATQVSRWFEDMVNRGRARFDTGHTYNTIISGLYELRKRL